MCTPFRSVLSIWVIVHGAALAQAQPSAEAEGLQLFAKGRYQQAAPLLAAASAASPDRPELARALGLCYLRLQNTEGARAAFARLFGVPAESAAARLLNAKMMLGEQLEELAEPELHAAVRLNPKLPEAHFMLGELAIFRGNNDAGIAELREEIALNPAFGMAYYRLGDAYTRKNMWTEAVAPLEKAIWLNPDFSSPYILLGKAYYHTDRLEFAAGMLKQAVRMDPNNAGAHYLLASVYRGLGKHDDARKELDLWRSASQK
ncbi:MAG TPA: tetratricopeptide repeat protein [Bryobacteraceae bacterium]|nr:tetratricopeptide repeat protein [Bryobacteraceae bacterium]